MNKPLLLWGGVDINPEIYGQKPMIFTQSPSDYRDYKETKEFKQAMLDKRSIVGVCRGAQLICALHGGKLHQHTEPSKQSHPVVTKDGRTFNYVAADHHQVMIPSEKEDFEILAWNPESTKVWLEEDHIVDMENLPEVIYYPKYNHIAIQFHPEWSNPDSDHVVWVNELLNSKGIEYTF